MNAIRWSMVHMSVS
uniref:Uncharacterized protein n=1 Tax=Solanum lycopersicum TaxID=4081 RepID=A0A3Q7I9A1_SOLLC